MKKIAIQGVPGSYHDIAAHKFFPGEEIELICCSTFEEIFSNMKQDSNVIGMLAIENTIAGSLLHNYELLRESGMTIIGEHKLRIKHSFMCLPDDDWNTLTEVNSHPVALAQCREFLMQHPKLKIVETEDTAGSAETIKRENLERSCRHLFQICRRSIRNESIGRRHRNKQTQLHAFPCSGRPMESR